MNGPTLNFSKGANVAAFFFQFRNHLLLILKYHKAFDEVTQFTEVSRPVVLLACLNQARRKFAAAVDYTSMKNQTGNAASDVRFPPGARAREEWYRKGVETIEEVFAKCTVLYGFLNIDIGGGEQAEIRGEG